MKTLDYSQNIVFKTVIPRLLLWWTFLDLFLKLLIAERYFRENLSWKILYMYNVCTETDDIQYFTYFSKAIINSASLNLMRNREHF